MTVASYRQVLKLAQQLPFNSQLELAEALLGNVRMTLNPLSETEAAVNLSPLLGMSESELEALAEAVEWTSHRRLEWLPLHINDPAFAQAAVAAWREIAE